MTSVRSIVPTKQYYTWYETAYRHRVTAAMLYKVQSISRCVDREMIEIVDQNLKLFGHWQEFSAMAFQQDCLAH